MMDAKYHVPVIKDDIKKLEKFRTDLALMINATPTGPARNALCDANIHAYATIEALQLAMEELRK